jgi:Domain of unknown function (DUF4365)
VLTEPHIIESLSRAYIRAIAGKAGLNLSIREYDYGVDGNFDEVIIRKNRRVESGFSLSFQLKASTQWQRDDTSVTYDLEAKTYNDLVIRRSLKMAVPCILLLLTLPPDSSEWLIYKCDFVVVAIGNTLVALQLKIGKALGSGFLDSNA